MHIVTLRCACYPDTSELLYIRYRLANNCFCSFNGLTLIVLRRDSAFGRGLIFILSLGYYGVILFKRIVVDFYILFGDLEESDACELF